MRWRTPRRCKKRALVFTYGFNTLFDDATIRFAQSVEDTQFNSVPVLFIWPSRSSISDYGYDKDSANFSRDAMESVLQARARHLGAVDLFAHSMGNWLTLQTLRQLANDTPFPPWATRSLPVLAIEGRDIRACFLHPRVFAARQPPLPAQGLVTARHRHFNP